MFNNLNTNLGNIFSKLRGKAVLSASDIDTTMRDIRIALLEADVSLSVVKAFTEDVAKKAKGESIIKSVSSAHMLIKIVEDQLTHLLGDENSGLDLQKNKLNTIMMVGLQGSGKTTSSAKLANLIKKKNNKKILLASLDTYRPAAQQQLERLGETITIDTLPIIEKETPDRIAKRAHKQATKGDYDVLILDTAGRLHVDPLLMAELQTIKKITSPNEILLVADALTGQEAVNIAEQFHQHVTITGTILTRIDGDGRGGAALSIRHVTGCPIKFMGVGEKIDEFEPFHPERIASRILGMGDITSLVEQASEHVEEEDAAKLEKKMRKGTFNLDDMAKQFSTMRKMGGIGKIAGMIPGINSQQLEGKVDDNQFAGMEAIISSMTKKERKYPKTINSSRKQRIAKGAGCHIQQVNRLLKQHKKMTSMMKKVSKMDKKQLMSQFNQALPQ